MTRQVIVALSAASHDHRMTNTTHTHHHLEAAPSPAVLTDPVRRVLAVDAGLCLGMGALLLAAAAPIAERADLAAPTFVRVLGAFLLVLGVDLVLFARAPQRWARLGAAFTGVGDVAWVAGSVALVATADLPGWAAAAVLAQAVVVPGIAATKRAALLSTRR
jgi:hypothetical protein